ncbi:MAG: hypothetical protein PVG96_06130 [Desulfobacterales bacterium]|jgi:hypothetical protein
MHEIQVFLSVLTIRLDMGMDMDMAGGITDDTGLIIEGITIGGIITDGITTMGTDISGADRL